MFVIYFSLLFPLLYLFIFLFTFNNLFIWSHKTIFSKLTFSLILQYFFIKLNILIFYFFKRSMVFDDIQLETSEPSQRLFLVFYKILLIVFSYIGTFWIWEEACLSWKNRMLFNDNPFRKKFNKSCDKIGSIGNFCAEGLDKKHKIFKNN